MANPKTSLQAISAATCKSTLNVIRNAIGEILPDATCTVTCTFTRYVTLPATRENTDRIACGETPRVTYETRPMVPDEVVTEATSAAHCPPRRKSTAAARGSGRVKLDGAD